MAGILIILGRCFDNPLFGQSRVYAFTFTSSAGRVAPFTNIVLAFIVILRTRANTFFLGAQQVKICIAEKAVCGLRPHTLLTTLVASLTWSSGVLCKIPERDQIVMALHKAQQWQENQNMLQPQLLLWLRQCIKVILMWSQWTFAISVKIELISFNFPWLLKFSYKARLYKLRVYRVRLSKILGEFRHKVSL